jgi:predicted DCC family thiol-disulfide oxidoreductase YuxK
MDSSVHWVLWDGACDFCAWSIARLRRHDTQGRFRIVPFQSAPPELLQCVSPNALRRGVHVITADGRVLRSGRAVLFIASNSATAGSPAHLACRRWCGSSKGYYWVVARLRGKLSRWLRLSETECSR